MSDADPSPAPSSRPLRPNTYEEIRSSELSKAKRSRRVFYATALVIGTFGIILIIASMSGRIFPMVDSAAAGIIGTAITALSALLSTIFPIIAKTDSNVEETRNELLNNHRTNVRDDLDDKHGEILANITSLRQDMSSVILMVSGVQTEIRDIGRRVDGLEHRRR